jgi:hypothetical protein
MNLFNLFAKLTLDKSDYDKNIDDAKKKSENFAEKTLNSIKVISANAWIELGQKVLGVANQIKNATLDLVNYADKYDDLSAKYDISTASLQEFEYIASQNGTTLESLLSTMTMMYNRAKEGDEVFDKLGISIKDTNGNMKSMADLFWETKTAIDQVSNSGDQSALMLEAFGRNAMETGEVLRRDTNELKQMAEKAHEVGIILSEETTTSAGAFNDMLAEMKLRGQSAFAEFFMGAEGSSEKVDEFLDDIANRIEDYTPKFLEIGLKLGWSLVKGIFKGVGGLISGGFKWLFGIEDEENTQQITSQIISDTNIMPSGSYEVNHNNKQTMDINITATGDNEISKDNASLIAEQLIPYIDKKLGEV